jgi:DNA-binding response OmpR family regulator
VSHNILLVEDDDGIALPLVRALSREGYAVERVAEGLLALEKAGTGRFHLVVLDLGLPDMDGLDVCRLLREDGGDDAVLILTARDGEIDRVVGLDVGADDYMVKPFSLAEMLARVRALLRRSTPGPAPEPAGASGAAGAAKTDTTSRVHVNAPARKAFACDQELSLTVKEFDVLSVLDAQRGNVVTREHLMDRVWDENWFGSTKTLDVTMGRLRQKLDAVGCSTRIVTVRGVGFRLEDTTTDA